MWLPKNVFDMIYNECKIPASFMTNMTIAVFGYDILRKSTITGRGNNRNNTKSKGQEMEQLDPLCVLAIKGENNLPMN